MRPSGAPLHKTYNCASRKNLTAFSVTKIVDTKILKNLLLSNTPPYDFSIKSSVLKIRRCALRARPIYVKGIQQNLSI
jgi:hypothetical protein